MEGWGNRLAAAAAQRLLKSGRATARFSYTAVLVWVKPTVAGHRQRIVEKTVLMPKCAYALGRLYPQLEAAVRSNAYDVFKQQYKQYDLLIIDDIQFIKGKDRTMEELLLSVQPFPQREKKQLILTCDVLPARIEAWTTVSNPVSHGV